MPFQYDSVWNSALRNLGKISKVNYSLLSTILTIENKQRFFGFQANNKQKSNISSSFPNLNRYLGFKTNFKVFQKEKNYILNDIKLSNCQEFQTLEQYNLLKQDLLFVIDEEFIFPESLLASFINKIKYYVLHQKKDIICLTVAVPDYCTLVEIEALTRSLMIANIDSFYLIYEQTACIFILIKWLCIMDIIILINLEKIKYTKFL